MRSEGGVLSSIMLGIAVFLAGVFFERLLMVLGFLIVGTGTIARLVENHQMKKQLREMEIQQGKLVNDAG